MLKMTKHTFKILRFQEHNIFIVSLAIFQYLPWKIYIVSAWALIPLAKYNPAIFSVPEALKNLMSAPRQTKSPDNSNVLHMFNSNSYTNFRTAWMS